MSIVAKIEDEKKYWRYVLKYIIATVKFLASHGLAFRGRDKIFGSPHNSNYMGALELLAKFDDVLSAHITKYRNSGSGNTPYLSSTACNEFIDVVALQVQKTIPHELREAKYYSITVDSTLDVQHTDQLTFVVRYVQQNGKPVE